MAGLTLVQFDGLDARVNYYIVIRLGRLKPAPPLCILAHYFKVLFSPGPDDDGVVVLAADGGGASVHRGGLHGIRKRHAELHMKLFGSAGTGEFDSGNDTLRFRLVPEVEIDAAPTRGRLIDTDGLAGGHPGARHALGKIEAVFVVIFDGQHPADHAGDGLLRGDAECRLARPQPTPKSNG